MAKLQGVGNDHSSAIRRGCALSSSVWGLGWAFALVLVFSPLASSFAETPAPTVIQPLMTGEEPVVVTEHTMQTPDGPLQYEARAGRLAIRVDETGEIHAQVFFVAYIVKNRGGRRPITFAWNGGPTVPSIYLHTELLGPRRLTSGGFVDNPQSLLAKSDLVFMDPVETGFSRPEKPEFANEFLNMKGDVAAAGEFVRAYRVRFGAEIQPLFLLGESYGVWRAAAVSDFLATRGVDMAGVIMISGGFPGAKMPFAFTDAMDVQARAATAFYYKRLPPALLRDRDATLATVNEWVTSAYLPALNRIADLSASERETLARKLAQFTGLRPDQIDRQTLVVTTNAYLTGFFAGDKAHELSELDTRISGPAPINSTTSAEAIDPNRAHYISRYLREELGYATGLGYSGELNYSTDLTYRALEAGYVPTPGPPRRRTGEQWSYNQSPEAPAALVKLRATGDGKFLDAANPPWIVAAMTAEPKLRVFAAIGRFDPTNSCEGEAHTVAALAPALARRVTSRCYNGGHMMYRDEDERVRLLGDLSSFVSEVSH